MEKSFTLIHMVATAGVFSAVSCWYGFMFGRESARKELGDLIESLRRDNSSSSSSSPPRILDRYMEALRSRSCDRTTFLLKA